MITVTDLFAGAGGSSTGATQVPGVHVRIAANHWQTAIDIHNANHQNTDHANVDLHEERASYFPRTDMLWASPECFGAGTFVLCERGLVPIEQVRVGDLVLTHAGRFRKVTDIMSRRADTVRLIGQGNSRGLEVTTNHPIWTANDSGVTDWTKVEDISIDGSTRWATPIEHPTAEVPRIDDGRRPIHVNDTRFAWLVGRWLGDGSLRVRPKGSDETFVTCGNHEADELESALSWVHHDCGECPPELTWSRRQLRTAVVFANSHSGLARWLVEHFGQHAHGKTVPAWALGAPEEWRRALLDGYLSADGHETDIGWQASSVSKRLALGIRLLAESLGHRASLTYSHRDTWRIENRTGRARPQWTVTWLHEIKRHSTQTARVIGAHSWGVVKAIEPEAKGAIVYDLTVEEDHSFVADGIVVHNCTKWSQANGSKMPDIEEGLFEDPLADEVKQRSRLLMFDVLRFIEHHRYRLVVVENVVDIATQAKYRTAWTVWRQELRALGYAFRVLSLNSMHASLFGSPAPQSRDRIYVVAWPEGKRAPNLDRVVSPPAFCERCDVEVRAVQSFRRNRTVGRYRQAYDYRCGGCAGIVEPYWMPAAAAIDWSLPGERIGDRDKPLAAKTLARIAAGIARYWGPLTLEAAGNTYDASDPAHRRHGDPNGYARTWPTSDPLTALHTTNSKALAVPVEGREGKEAAPLDVVLRTQTTRAETALAVDPLIVEMYGTSTARPTSDAMGTVTAGGNHHGLAHKPFVTQFRDRDDGNLDPEADPLRTIVADGASHGLVMEYYSRDDAMHSTSDPLMTVTTEPRHALVRDPFMLERRFEYRARGVDEPMATLTANDTSKALVHRMNGGGAEMSTPAVEYLRTLTTGGQVALLQRPARRTVTAADLAAARDMLPDVLFRMFRPHEVALGMAFPATYNWQPPNRLRPVSNRDLVKAAGNAVTPPAARDIIGVCVDSLERSAA